MTRRVPVRTCLGCKQRAAISELLRVVAVEQDAGSFRLQPDLSRTMPGRGAHVHPEAGCLDSALRRRAFGRALRISGVIHAEALRKAIAEPVKAGNQTVGGAPAPPSRKVGRPT